MLESFDHLDIYCPHLGMMLTFSYCRRVQSSLPCRNVKGCWEKRIPVEDFLKENLSPEELDSAFGGLPKTRLERIFDGVQQAREIGPPEKQPSDE